MALLRITQQPMTRLGHYHVIVTFTDDEHDTRSASARFKIPLSDQDCEDIRWYLEDYLEFDEHPAPQIAARIEKRMEAVGEALGLAILHGSHQTRSVWAAARLRLGETRIEVENGGAGGMAIPWELLRDPENKDRLALQARAFVRTPRRTKAASFPPPMAASEVDKVRVLLAICRPRRAEDVPFRSIANRVLKALSGQMFDVDVLRPPTYEHLAWTLRRAKERGAPCHVVHFDGHGTYTDPDHLAQAGNVISGLRSDAQARSGRRGFLVFEDPHQAGNEAFVDGFALGNLMHEASVPLLVVNACQSAFTETPAMPRKVASGRLPEEVEAYSSLAEAVTSAGTTNVVAMAYVVYVATAARFVAELYAGLAHGRTLGEAASGARQHLANQPERHVGFKARPLQDWSVPVVWERAPFRLWPEASALELDSLGEWDPLKRGRLIAHVPAPPQFGFFGRDETIYALDRAFDGNGVVLLHGYAGAGKTATALEFARWYAATGGLDGPVLFDSFERRRPLARVLDSIGEVFRDVRSSDGRPWGALTNTPEDQSERRRVALAQLNRSRVLWIWDNVEGVGGFPAGSLSEWSVKEQLELRDFLEAARATKAKFLLTSRREELDWLGELPARVSIPPMPMQERLELAAEIAKWRGAELAKLPNLRELLRFTDGNPLTILVTIGQTLREGIDTKERLEAFIARLRAGQQAFADDAAERRDRSLGASLAYGFSHGFSEQERRAMSLLHLFQGFVDAGLLSMLGDPELEWCVEAARGLSQDKAIALLDRAAEVGLLSRQSSTEFAIHPAVPWFFRELFERLHPSPAGDRARLAFAETMGAFATPYAVAYEQGYHPGLPKLRNHEDNLLAAWTIARANGQWHTTILVMQCLFRLYDQSGRRAAWRQLVEALVPDFVDPLTGGPRNGRERVWGIYSLFRVDLAVVDRNWQEAERLQRLDVDWEQERAQALLGSRADTLNVEQEEGVRSLGISIMRLGEILQEQRDPACVETFREAIKVFRLIGATESEAICTRNLGNAYKNISAIRNLTAAERWYRRTLELVPGDILQQAWAYAQLGGAAYERYRDADAAGQPQAKLTKHLKAASNHYLRALSLLPDTALQSIGGVHCMLGTVLSCRGLSERGLHHLRKAVQVLDGSGYLFDAGKARMNLAAALLDTKRLADARSYAEAALVNFRQIGDGAADEAEAVTKLLFEIEEARGQS
jgi:tetratricopeptide (TPR) repeat protein